MNEWPDIDPISTFDWSLSLKEIEQKFPIVQNKPAKKGLKFFDDEERVDKIEQPLGSQELFIKALSNKYAHIYELLIRTNEDLPRWIYDNLITKTIT